MKPQKPETIRLGILSDTHIPDRASQLPQGILEAFATANVDAILHAGDICSQIVLDQLSKIAPVYAVQGNRDWLYRFKLPKTLELTFNNLTVTLTHGHVSLWQYFLDLIYYGTHNFQYERSYKTLKRVHPNAKFIIFGHTHRKVFTTFQGVTFLNPGSCLPCIYNNGNPNYVLMTISSSGGFSVDCYQL